MMCETFVAMFKDTVLENSHARKRAYFRKVYKQSGGTGNVNILKDGALLITKNNLFMEKKFK